MKIAEELTLKSLMTHDKEVIARWYLDLVKHRNIRDELIRYKIWENIFGGNYDTLEPMIDEYLKQQQ